jgi:amidase
MAEEAGGAFVAGPRLNVVGAGLGALAGLSFAAKDLFDVAGHPTGGGNPDWERTHPVLDRHAWAVQALLDAGASLVGKTTTCEVSMGILGFNPHCGTPSNPAAPGHLPGGSSSGSASAVAAGACDAALGTDSGGSVRVPASFCGLYGLCPTHGRIPFDGVCRQAPSFDTVGWFARDATTFARIAAAMLEEPVPEPEPCPILVADDAFALADPGVEDALAPAVAALGALLGGAPRPSALAAPGELHVWADQRNVLQRAEAWRTFEGWIDAHNPRFGFNVARNLALASAITPERIGVAEVVRRRVRDRAEALLGTAGGRGPVLCLPTTPFAAPPLGLSLAETDRLSGRIGLLASFAGLAGVPQISLPVGLVDGRPVGLSIIAARGGDARLAGIARALARHPGSSAAGEGFRA